MNTIDGVVVTTGEAHLFTQAGVILAFGVLAIVIIDLIFAHLSRKDRDEAVARFDAAVKASEERTDERLKTFRNAMPNPTKVSPDTHMDAGGRTVSADR